MSQIEEPVIEKMGVVFPKLSKRKKEHFIGIVEGIALMCEPEEPVLKLIKSGQCVIPQIRPEDVAKIF